MESTLKPEALDVLDRHTTRFICRPRITNASVKPCCLLQVKMEATLKPEALDVLDRRIGQLQMEAASLKLKAKSEWAQSGSKCQSVQQQMGATPQHLVVWCWARARRLRTAFISFISFISFNSIHFSISFKAGGG